MKMKFTKKSLDELAPADKRYEVFDIHEPGFCIRVGLNGEKSFYYFYRNGKGRGGKLRRLFIGKMSNVTLEQAKTILNSYKARIVLGDDPVNDINLKKKEPILENVIEEFFINHVDTKLKDKTKDSYRNMKNNFIIPALGKKKITEVSFKDVSKLHADMKNTPYQANRCIALLSKFFNWCELEEYRKVNSNPVKGIEKYKEKARTVFMEKDTLELIGKAIYELEQIGSISIYSLTAIKILLLTGARKGEILSLKWSYFNANHTQAILPDSKTGQKIIIIPSVVWELLSNLPQENEYCFPGNGKEGHLVDIKKTWRIICEKAGISGWRIHDLRHAFAAYAASSGQSLPIIGSLLGHSQPQTTARYAHLANNPIRQAAEETAGILIKDLRGGG